MNNFKAMSKVLSIARKNPTEPEWSFSFNGRVFAKISKSNSQYFVHYEGRNTALQGYTHFMKAAAFIADLYCRLYNSHMVAGGTEITFYNHVQVFVGSDGKLYTGQKGLYTIKQVLGTCYNHLSKYYSDSMSDIEIGYFADVMEQAYSDFINRED